MALRVFALSLALFLSACVPKSDLDSANKQIGELQAQVATLKSKIVELKAQVSSAKNESAQLKSQVSSSQTESAQLKAQLEKKPPLPIAVSFRKALSGPGYVAIFSTTVKSPISVLATLKSAALGTSKQFELHINPDTPHQIGHLEGAVIEQGDIITLENQNYSPTTITASVN